MKNWTWALSNLKFFSFDNKETMQCPTHCREKNPSESFRVWMKSSRMAGTGNHQFPCLPSGSVGAQITLGSPIQPCPSRDNYADGVKAYTALVYVKVTAESEYLTAPLLTAILLCTLLMPNTGKILFITEWCKHFLTSGAFFDHLSYSIQRVRSICLCKNSNSLQTKGVCHSWWRTPSLQKGRKTKSTGLWSAALTGTRALALEMHLLFKTKLN